MTKNPKYQKSKPKQGLSQDFWQGRTIWSEAIDIATCFESEAARSAADRATAGGQGAQLSSGVLGAEPTVGVRAENPPENVQDFMLILDPESTC